MQKCTLALVFWKPEENFKSKSGIIQTEVGHAVDKVIKLPMEVCTGNTGHAEVVRLTFDENKISFKDTRFIFKCTTQLKDMQFPDIWNPQK